jgi:hypothetical protein
MSRRPPSAYYDAAGVSYRHYVEGSLLSNEDTDRRLD